MPLYIKLWTQKKIIFSNFHFLLKPKSLMGYTHWSSPLFKPKSLTTIRWSSFKFHQSPFLTNKTHWSLTSRKLINRIYSQSISNGEIIGLNYDPLEIKMKRMQIWFPFYLLSNDLTSAILQMNFQNKTLCSL